MNYGIAGHYEPHFDFARVSNKIVSFDIKFVSLKPVHISLVNWASVGLRFTVKSP